MKIKLKPTKPLSPKPLLRLVKKPKPEQEKEKVVYGLLHRYERTEIEIANLQNAHREIFEALERLEAEKKEAVEAIKRITYTNEGPPPGVEGKMAAPAQGQLFRIEVQYPRAADYYDPERLPREALLVRGAVTSVDKDTIDTWLSEHPEFAPLVRPALRVGGWLTPRVCIKRL